MSKITKSLGSLAAPGTLDRVELLETNTRVSLQYNLTGDPLTATVDYEGSLDGVNWGLVDSHVFTAGELAAMSAFVYIVDKPVPYFRINVSTLTFTTAGTIDTLVRYEES